MTPLGTIEGVPGGEIKMKGNMKHLRQGDLLFVKTDKKATGKTQEQLLVAEGEFTGHHHVLIAETGIIGDKEHFTLTGKAKLTHPEHDTIELPVGNYIVRLEREFDYIDEELKQVRD